MRGLRALERGRLDSTRRARFKRGTLPPFQTSPSPVAPSLLSLLARRAVSDARAHGVASLAYVLYSTGRNVGAMLIATPGWDAFRSAAMVRPPVLVYFDAYTNRQLRDVLTRERPKDADATLYRDFLGAVPVTVARAENRHVEGVIATERGPAGLIDPAKLFTELAARVFR